MSTRFNASKTAKELAYFINEQVNLANKAGVVLGFGGGVDSAVCAALAHQAKVPVHLLWMPVGPAAPPEGTEKLAERLDAHIVSFDIKKSEVQLGGSQTAEAETATRNCIARVRMKYLYDCAHWRDWLVLGTSNRSEWMLGHFTKHGDGACDLVPLIYTYKTDVYKLARHLRVPREIINRPPSAGLWEGQTDEDELGWGYDKIDAVLRDRGKALYRPGPVWEGLRRHLVFDKGHDAALVDMVLGRILQTEHKRHGAYRPFIPETL